MSADKKRLTLVLDAVLCYNRRKDTLRASARLLSTDLESCVGVSFLHIFQNAVFDDFLVQCYNIV